MKKLTFWLLAAFMTLGFTACDDNENGGEAVETISGFYTINGGNKRGKIPASLTAYDYTTGESIKPLEDAFFAANGIALGDGAQQAVICNGKMYIAMYTSNLIWVVEPETLKIISSIKPDGDAVSPRAMAAKDNKLYCTMYTGYVSEIDATKDEITRNLKVGSNPDGIALAGNKLVVANTDGMNSKNGYADNGVSIVDLATFTQVEIKNTKFPGNHSTEVASNGRDAFVVMQSYDETCKILPIIVKVAGNTEDDIVKVCNGTNIDVWGNNLYVIDAPYYGKAENITYKVYDVNSFAEKGQFIKQTSGSDSEILAPNGVFVDPVGGDIVMLSYYLKADGTNATQEPSYANIYDNAGNFKKRIDCGVGARAVTFIHEKIAK